jgi:hypothetical protein
MTCIECANADAKSNPVYARIGLAKCIQFPTPTGHFLSMTFKRECKAFAPADPEEVLKRRTWLEKQRSLNSKKEK